MSSIKMKIDVKLKIILFTRWPDENPGNLT